MGWVVSTDQLSMHRSQSVSQWNSTAGQGVSPTLAVNYYSTEVSDWQISEMLVYSGTLSTSDMQAVETYLTNQYIRGINYVTISISGGNSPTYRAVTPVTATVLTSSKVTFKVNNKSIPGCKNIVSSSMSATCNWAPAQHTQLTVSATAAPISDSYTTSSASVIAYVQPRAASSKKR